MKQTFGSFGSTVILFMAALVCTAALHDWIANAGDGVVFDSGTTPHITLTMPDDERTIQGEQGEQDAPPLKITIYPEEVYPEQETYPRHQAPGSIRLEQHGHTSPRFDYAPHEATPSERRQNYTVEKDSKQHAQKAYPRKEGPHQSGPYEISGVKIVDIYSGKTMPIHTVDLWPTIERINAGVKNSHKNDGSIYRNFSRKLPRRDRNYYREYVVPTHGIRGPGPQRLIIGERGDIYYTPDHYETFVKVERE